MAVKDPAGALEALEAAAYPRKVDIERRRNGGRDPRAKWKPRIPRGLGHDCTKMPYFPRNTYCMPKMAHFT